MLASVPDNHTFKPAPVKWEIKVQRGFLFPHRDHLALSCHSPAQVPSSPSTDWSQAPANGEHTKVMQRKVPRIQKAGSVCAPLVQRAPFYCGPANFN